MQRGRRQTFLAQNYLVRDLAAASNADHGKSNAIAKFLATAVSDLDSNAVTLLDPAGHRKGPGGRLIPVYSIGLPGLK